MNRLSDMILAHVVAMGQEKKEACIHCGNVWYSIHYRDGVCHQCQQLGKPGRAELAARKRSFQRTLVIGVLTLCLLILRAIFG